MASINSALGNQVLGTLRKNDKSRKDKLNKLATGQKLNSAGDGASEYSISEKMRVRLRALDQAKDNTSTGYNMLKVASGAVQEQLDIMRTIKQKVIDANNDTNTDRDREIIQKDIRQGFQQIEDITYDTTYNGKALLYGGDHVKKTVYAWDIKNDGIMVEGSDRMHYIISPGSVISDSGPIYRTLDDLEGPFATFSIWEQKDSSHLTLNAPYDLKTIAASAGAPAYITANFNYASVSQMENDGIYIRNYKADGTSVSKYFVMSSTPLASGDYQYSPNVVNINGCTTIEQALERLKDAINAVDGLGTATLNGQTMTITSENTGTLANNSYMSAYSRPERIRRTAALATGLIPSGAQFSGGIDQQGIEGDPDSGYVAPAYATYTVDVSNGLAGRGFTVNLGGDNNVYIRLKDGKDTIYNSSDIDSDGIQETDDTYTVGKNASFSQRSLSNGKGNGTNLLVSMDNGVMTFTSYNSGSAYNSWTLSDGFDSDTLHYTEVNSAQFSPSPVTTPSEATPAKLLFDVSAYKDNTSTEDAEEFIASLAGITDRTLQIYSTLYFEFIDTGATNVMAGLTKSPSKPYPTYVQGENTVHTMDLNNLRNAVASGETIAAAFTNLVYDSFKTYYNSLNPEKVETDGQLTGVTFYRNDVSDPNSLMRENDVSLGYYKIDFSGIDCSNPADLDETGFRFYCATDKLQWYNIMLFNGEKELPEDRPESGTENEDITTIRIDIAGDVSGVRTPADLVNVIFAKGDADLAALNHYYRMAKTDNPNELIIYDPRRMDVLTDTFDYPYHNVKGAKIADGAYDNVVLTTRDIMEKTIVIQDTDKASMHTRIFLPQMTMDHILGYKPGVATPDDYTVTNAKIRHAMLGEKHTNGIIGNAIEYLLDAQTTLGAQAARLENTNSNLVTATENEQASESAIRDADMAKEMTGFVRANLLAQSSQAMLAQANQTAGSVLSLLQ